MKYSFQAVIDGSLPMVKFLLKKGANINAQVDKLKKDNRDVISCVG